MADIEYRCSACGKPRVVSEFADVTKLKCAACGGPLQKGGVGAPSAPMPVPEAGEGMPAPIPVTEPAPAGGSRLKVAKQQREQLETENPVLFTPPNGKAPKAPVPAEAFKADDLLRQNPLELHPKVSTRRKGVSHTLLAFLLFGLIGAATGYLRYGSEMNLPGCGHIPVKRITDLMEYAWAGILLLNLVVVLKAMSDNMFQGILCLLVPGWTVVYLLFISDNFYLRAIFFGCLVGLAQDGSFQLYEIAVRAMATVTNFIDSGGGSVRPRELP